MYGRTDGRTDGLTDKLIWGRLGNLRFLQVNNIISSHVHTGVLDSHGFMILNLICWACAIFCWIPNLQACTMYERTDGQTDKLIWGGLGNLRFLQVNRNSQLQSRKMAGLNTAQRNTYFLRQRSGGSDEGKTTIIQREHFCQSYTWKFKKEALF